MALSTTLRIALTALVGVVAMVGYPPYEWSLPSWAGWVGFIWLLSTSPTIRVARWTGFIFSLGFYGTLLWWFATVELLAFYPMVILQSLPMFIVAGGVYRFRTASPATYVLAVAGSMGLAEYLRARFPWGGFPWGTLGQTVSATPLRASSQWWGATGWTVILMAVGAVLVLFVQKRIRWQPVGVAVALVVVAALLGNAFPSLPNGETLEVAIVQGNWPCPRTHCSNERTLRYEDHLAMTRELSPGDYDLVVWAESSTGGRVDPIQNPTVAEEIGAEAERLGAVFLVGGDRDAGPEHFINVNAVFDSSGQIVGEYRKRHGVPFGEYVPFRPQLDWIPALDRVPRDILTGPAPVTFEVGDVTFASVISFEGAFSRYERQSLDAGAQFMVVATLEGSFGDASSEQFIAISRVRAAEMGIDIVHAATTGRSAIVHADGEIEDVSGIFTAEIVEGTVTAREGGPTLFTRWGDWLQALAAVGYLALRARQALIDLGGKTSE